MISELNGDFLQWLRGFYYVATTGSVRSAANLMNRNPSTISYQLKALEDELGTLLFDRNKKSLRITESGKSLLSWTISTFETFQEMRSAIGNKNGEFRGPVSIAATLPIIALASDALGNFARKHQKIQLRIERGLSNQVRCSVNDARADFGLLPVITPPGNADFEVILQARPMLVLHKSNPWEISSRPGIDELKNLPFVSFMESEGVDELGHYMASSGLGDFVQRNAVIQVNNYHLILRFVWQKLGVALMDELCFEATRFGAKWDTLMAFPLDYLLPNRKYGILTRKNRRFGLQTIALMTYLRGFFQSLASDGTVIAWENVRQKN